jgi:hypothetical protein
MKVKLTREQTYLLYRFGSYLNTNIYGKNESGEEYYYLPYYFKIVEGNEFEIVSFAELSEDVKKSIEAKGKYIIK